VAGSCEHGNKLLSYMKAGELSSYFSRKTMEYSVSTLTF